MLGQWLCLEMRTADAVTPVMGEKQYKERLRDCKMKAIGERERRRRKSVSMSRQLQREGYRNWGMHPTGEKVRLVA